MRHLILLLSFPAILCASPRVWFIHDLVKIDPRSGAAREAGDLYLSRQPAGYQEKNGVWDAKDKTIRLRGLRDEVVAFQVVVESDKPLAVDSISVAGLKGPGLSLFREWFLKVTEPSWNKARQVMSFGPGYYPCQLIPMGDPDLKEEFAWPVRLPCPSNKIDGQKALVFWADIYIPDTLSPGLHKGKVMVTINGRPRQFSLELIVGGNRMPAVNHSGFIGTTRSIRYYYVNKPELVQEINFLFHSHRLDMDPYTWYPETEGLGDSLKVIWDRRTPNLEKDALGNTDFIHDVAPYFKPEAYTEKNGYRGPAKNAAPSWITLPLQVGWFKRKGVDYGDSLYWPSFKAACRRIHDKFNELGITQKRMVFINKGDEPKDLETLNLGRDHGLALLECKKAFGMEYFNRLDIGGISHWGMHHFGKGWDIDSFYDYLKDAFQIMNLNPGNGEYYLKKYPFPEFRKNHPWQFWIYESNTSGEPGIGNVMLDCEAVGTVNWPWIMYRYRIDGGMFWEALDGIYSGDSVWLKPLFSKQDFAITNGDGAALYEGSFVFRKPKMVPSIRLKLNRRGNQDYEYLYLLNLLRGDSLASDSVARALIPAAQWESEIIFERDDWKKHIDGTLHPDDPKNRYMQGRWSHDPEEWIKARNGLFELIERSVKSPEH